MCVIQKTNMNNLRHLCSFFIFTSLVFCDKSTEKRFLTDPNSNLTDVVAKLSSEVKALTQSQTSFKYDLINLTETLNYVNKQLQETRLQLSHAQNNAHTFLSANPGSVYVRWGRSKCSSDAELVYSGYAGGSIWTSTGAASNYICLVQDPVLIANVTGDKGAQVFGAEYVFDNAQWVSASNSLYGKDITFQDVPCAVCRTPRLSTVMVPGKTTCSSGWREEYSGYLSAGYYGHSAASEFVCLDRDGEVKPNTSNKELGKLFYSVRARCGSLPCPPYEEGKDLTCVVCSK